MANFPPAIDYTDRDFDALRERLIKIISSVYPTWTEFEVATFGTILIEAFAFVGDVNTFYQNRQAREAFWGMAQLRKSLLSLGKLIGYQPSTATASLVDVDITLANPPAAADVLIPTGTRVSTQSVTEPAVFETLSDVVIPAGQTSIGVSAENSESREETFESTGLVDQEIRLADVPFLDGSLEISDAIGTWTVVDSFLDSTTIDRHVTVTVDEIDRATIRFGDGTNGALPSGTITVGYKIGGGADGVVEAGAVRRIEGAFTDDFGNAVELLVTNANPSTAASDRPTLEQIRIEGPSSIKVVNRTVAKDDYEIGAREVPEVVRALMLTSDQDETITENHGDLLIVVEGGTEPTEATKDAVLERVTVTKPNTITFQLQVLGAPFAFVDVRAVVFLRSGFATAEAKAGARATIQADLESFFAIQNTDGTANDRIDFGFNYKDVDGNPDPVLAWSDVHNAVRDSSPVRKVDAGVDGFLLNGVRDDVTLLSREFPALGTVTLIDGNTGTEF